MKEAVSTCCRHKPSALASSIFFHISCPLLYNLVVLDWQVVEFVKLLFWVQRSGKIIQGIPRAAIHLMPQTRVVLPLAPFLRRRRFIFCVFFLPIYMVHLPHFPHFIFTNFWERKPVAFDSINSSFTFVTLSVVSLEAFLQKVILPLSFLFPSFSHYLLIAE